MLKTNKEVPHLLLETDDLVWGCCFAGCVKTGLKLITNSPFHFSLNSNKPELQKLAEHLDPFSSNMQKIVLPTTEEEFLALDLVNSKKVNYELYMSHGIPMDANNIETLGYNGLASTILLKDFGILSQVDCWYPKYSRKESIADTDFNMIIETESYRIIAEKFIEGFELTPKILNIESLSVPEQIKFLNYPGLKGFVVHGGSELLYIAKSYYGSYDNICNTFATILIHNNKPVNLRRAANIWGACVPHEESDMETIGLKGKRRKIQEECRFDHHVYFKKLAKGEYQNATS